MVNTTQFYKTKIALAVVLSLGLAACGDSEGDAGSTTTSTSTSDSNSQTDANQNTVGNQNELMVTVSGVVVDTNNQPLAGASVYLAGEMATTDAGGVYVFNDVNVTNVVGVNNEGDETNDSVGAAALTLTVMGPEGYLGGTITITPEAQVNNTGGQDGNAGTNSDTTIQTFVSGHNYGATKAVLPQLSAKVTGYLTDCSESYTSYDQVIEGAQVFADIISLSPDGSTETATPGSSFELSAPTLSATTDADGKFTITLPADSIVNLLAEDWGLDSDGVAPVDALDSDSYASTNLIVANQSTNNEQITQNIGIIQVCPFITPDTTVPPTPNTPPRFASIGGATSLAIAAGFNDLPAGATNPAPQAAEYRALDEGFVNDFEINFSEALPNMTTEDMRVYIDNTLQDPTTFTITLNADMAGLVLTFEDDLDPGAKVEFVMAHWLAEDDEGDDFVDNSGFAWDSVPVDGTRLAGLNFAKALYTSARFCIFEKAAPLDGDASITLIEQIIDADDSEDGSFSSLANYSSAFADNDDSSTTIDQLNGQSETAARLDALAEEILETTDGGGGAEVTFDVNDARVTYEDKSGSIAVTANPGTITDENKIYEIADTEDNTKVTAKATNIFGVVKATSSVTVYDKIAPTTVLQENYGITAGGAPKAGVPMVTTATTTGVTFGNGGEATDGLAAVAGSVGNPIVYVQPRHLVARGTDLITFTERGNEFDALNEDMDDRLATGETAGVIGVFANRPAYDRQAIAAWDAQSQRIGVSISEEFDVISGAVMGTADISTAITDPTALNGVLVDVDNNVLGAAVDLAAIRVADVVNLANNDHGGVLSFANVIQDKASTPNVALPGLGNVGGANAQIVFQDAFPAMVESAEWDGTNFTIVFNEGVAVPEGTDTLDIHLIDPRDATGATKTAITLDAGEDDDTVEGYFEYDENTFTLTVNVSTGIETMFIGSNSADEEYFYADDIAGSSSEEQHAILNWDSLEDLNGNTWLEFNGGVAANGIEAGVAGATPVFTNRYEVNAPVFLAVNTLGQLDVDLDFDNTTYNKRTLNAIADSDDAVTLLLTSTYPLDLDATFNAGADASITNLTNAGVAGTANGLILSGAAIDFLLVQGDFTIDTAASTGLVSKDRMTISFNIVVQNAGAGASTDYIEAADTVTINNTALDVANQATDTLGRDDAIQQLIFN